MLIRKTMAADIEAASEIYAEARRFMRQCGNPNQWSSTYPNEETVREDILSGNGYVCEDGGEVVGVFFFRVGNDPTYERIYDGKWLSDAPYAVIHRIAVKYQGRGIAGFIFRECFAMHPNLRIDTHRDNLPMQTSLKKNGFLPCGTIYLESGDPRIAFQKI